MQYKRLLDYNYWANERMCQCLQTLRDELLFAEIVSSYYGIAKTLMHLEGAERIWLKRIANEEVKGFDTAIPERTKLLAFPSTSKAWVDLIGQQEKGFENKMCHYKNLNGESFQSEISTILTHVVNHSSFHRGQLVTILRQLKVESIPATDFVVFDRISGS